MTAHAMIPPADHVAAAVAFRARLAAITADRARRPAFCAGEYTLALGATTHADDALAFRARLRDAARGRA
jgi:hypothetical protein